MRSEHVAPDTEGLDRTYFPVAAIEDIAKAAVRAALPADRHPMWQAFSDVIQDAAVASPSRMPWDPPEAVTRLPAGAAVQALKAMLGMVNEPTEQKRLAAIVARECERVEQEASSENGVSIPAGNHPVRHCAGCGRPYRPQRARSTWCSAACRQAGYKARKGAKRGNASPPE
jgi:hypothetical protein